MTRRFRTVSTPIEYADYAQLTDRVHSRGRKVGGGPRWRLGTAGPRTQDPHPFQRSPRALVLDLMEAILGSVSG